MKIYYFNSDSNKEIFNWGIFSVLSYLIENNDEISIYELKTAEEFDTMSNDEDTFFFLSIPFYSSMSTADYILDCLRRKVPNINNKKFKILVGGAAIPGINVQSFHSFYPEVDFIIFGNGEEISHKIINKEIIMPGVYDGNKHKEITSTINPFFTDKISKQIVPIFIDGRKCPWNKCKFCVHSQSDGISRSSQEVFSIIKKYYENGIKKYYICDNWLRLKKAYDIFDMLYAEGIKDVSFDFFGVHMKSNYKKLSEYINKFGPHFINDSSWGVEFLDDEILDMYSKGITVDQIFEHAKIFQDWGMELNVYMLLGLPGVKQHNIDSMYNNLLKYDQYVSSYQHSTFTLEENIDIFNKEKEFGFRKTNPITLDHQFQCKYPIVSTAYGYEIFDYENNAYISSDDNIKKYSHILKIMDDKNNAR